MHRRYVSALKMLSERVKPFKWKPFDLYNDICIERYRKINSPPIKEAAIAVPMTPIKDNSCDRFVCNRDNYYRSPPSNCKNDAIDRKSFLFGTNSNKSNACDFDIQCESNRKLNGFCVRNKFGNVSNDIDGGDNNNNNNRWPTVNLNKYLLSPNVTSKFTASTFTGSTGSSCSSSAISASSMSPNGIDTNCNTNNVDAIIMCRRSIDHTPPIVYGPLPYSKCNS